LESTDIDVAKLSDLELRRTLTDNGVSVGPVTSKRILILINAEELMAFCLKFRSYTIDLST